MLPLLLLLLVLAPSSRGDDVSLQGSTIGEPKPCFRVTNPRPGASPPTIGPDNFEEVLKEVANEKRELILSMYDIHVQPNGTLWDNEHWGMTAFNINLMYWLNKVGVKNILLVALRPTSCGPNMALGLPCYLNKFDWMRHAVHVRKGLPVVLKWYYLYKIVQAGYHPIFLDNDVTVLRNPFDAWNRSFDYQALSDARDDRGDLPKWGKDLLCPIGMYSHPFPCISTGTMFIRATEPSEALLAAMVEQLEEDQENGWEQATFQTVLLPFLMQMGNGLRPLKFRVLPLDEYHNIGPLHHRRFLHLETPSVVVHCGYIAPSSNKRKFLDDMGFWVDKCPE